LDREICHRILADGGVTVFDPRYQFELVSDAPEEKDDGKHKPKDYDLPLQPSDIHTHYNGVARLPDLQRSFTCQLEDRLLASFLDSADCNPIDTIRLNSCRASRGRWLSTDYAYLLSNNQANIVMRLWLGLDPHVNTFFNSCPLCHKDIAQDQWHALSCVKIRRKAITNRHDSAAQLLCRYARSNGALARVEPKDEGSLVPDGEVILPMKTILFDVSGTHPGAPSYRENNARHPGSAISARERIKNNKYLTYASNLSARFVPFVIDTFGWLGKPATKLVKEIEADAFHPRLGLPACTRITSGNFLGLLAVEWQRHNANVIFQWSSMIRRSRLRSATIHASPSMIIV
jgi:hypothetical protein